jgi:hypothetical protein
MEGREPKVPGPPPATRCTGCSVVVDGWAAARLDAAASVLWHELEEYGSGSLALQDDPYTPSTHTSLESPGNGGINGHFTSEHGLLRARTRGTIYYNVKMGFLASKW